MRRLLVALVAAAATATAAPALAAAAASPAGLTGVALDGSVDLAWQGVTGASGYDVYRGTTPSTVTTLISPTGGVAASGFTDTTAVDGTTYYYAVKPIVAGAESGSSLTVQATPRARSCSTGNVVVVENCYPGDTGWKIVGTPPAASAGGIEGYTTTPSINKTGSIDFKVTSAAGITYHADVYRSGYYGGVGARLFSEIRGIPGQAQPACTSDSSTGLYDCSNWSTSFTITTTASWPSGIYIVHLVRDDNSNDTQLVFVVRDDSRASAILFGAGVTTWQAYNNYGGKSLYSYNSSGANTVAGTARAVKVSFDRPYVQPRDSSIPNWYPRDEYPMVTWLESQGYDVSYIADTDLETMSIGTSHKAYMSAAHDEYISANMRAAMTAARDAGVNLFFSGSNAVYWKIRFENGPNGGVNRVEVCYKTFESGPADPVSPTTLWRDPAVNQPENALVGQMYVGDLTGTYYPLVVSAAEGTDRVWRYTGLDTQPAGTSTSVGKGLVGWEWDARNTTNGFEPAGVKTLATSQASGNILQPGGGYATGNASPNVTKYVAPSGALVFSTGTNHWDWGLAYDTDGNGEPTRIIQQATLNVLEDMGVTPATPSSSLTLDSATAPRVGSTTPTDGAAGVDPATTVTATFSRAMNAATITTSTFTLKTSSGTAVAGSVSYNSTTATATFTPSAQLAFSTTYIATITTGAQASDGTPLQTAANWSFTVKSAQNPVRVNAGGAAYTAASGATYLADQYFTGGNVNSTTATITGTNDPKLYQDERWGQFTYSIPVVNGTYNVIFHFVEMYYTTGSCVGKRIFGMDILNTTVSPDIANLDICAQAGGADKALDITVYGVSVTNGTLQVKSVYGPVDDPEVAAIEVVPATGPPPAPTVMSTTPANGATGVASNVTPTATFSRGMDASTITTSSFTLTAQGSSTPVPASVSYNATSNVATLTPSSALANSTTYTAKLDTTIKAGGDETPLASPVTWSFTTAASTPVGTTVRINAGGPAYTTTDGRSFSPDADFTGGSTNSTAAAISGTTDPTLFQTERWGNFSYSIPVINGTYNVSFYFVEMYYTSGSCIGKRIFSMDITNTPTSPDIANLDVCAAAGGADKALIKTVSNVQVTTGSIGIQSVYGSVDDPEVAAIEITPASAPTGPPTVVSTTPASGAAQVATTSPVTATFSRALDPTTVTTANFTLTAQGSSTPVPATVAYNSTTTTATLTPSSQLALSTTYTATVGTGVKASDGTPLAAPYSWSFTTASSVQQLSTVHINSGGGAYTASTGAVYAADTDFSGGNVNSSSATISGTNDPALYQNERWGSFSYSIPVVPGTYDVTFHFVELYYTSGSCIGKRIFSMDIAQTTTNPDIQNLDICAAAGGADRAYDKTITGVQAANGTIDIQSIYGSVDDPEVAAIDVTPSQSQPQPSPDPSQVGQWSAPVSWPIVAVHMAVLPTGNVIAWDGFSAAPNSQRVWNPATGAFTPVPLATNIFCSDHILLPDGRLLIQGGHVSADNGLPNTTIFDPATGTWTNGPAMSVARWYPTSLEMGSGKYLVFSGDNIVTGQTGVAPAFRDSSVNSLPEVYDPVANAYTDLTNSKLTTPLYPIMYQLSDGRILDAGPDTTTRTLDPTTWQWSTLGTSPFDGMSAVMYLPDKIMKAGSWADPDFNDSMAPGYTASGQTAVLDMTQASPAWKSTAPMNYGRAYENLTLLPDGTVLASGGESYSDGINLSKGVLPAEIWNPTTQAWTTVASLSTPREYHSTAVLLPDGRVLMAGGGALEGFSGVTNEDSAEIYSPPYLFKGTRPTITSVPSTVNYGQAFQVSTPDAASITKVALVGVPSVTHDDNPTARYIPLTFTAGSGSLTVTPPSNRNVAPPGYYYLFILNGNGVPSVASFVRFPAPWEDTQPPTAPGNLAATVSQSSVSLSWTASTDNVGVTVYDVFRSTTSGFTPSIANRIAQTSNLSYTDANRPAGTYYYVVEAEDAAGNASPPSNQATAVVAGDTTPPSAPTNLTGTGGIGTASLSWTASTDNVGVTGYEIWRGTASGAETKVGTSTSTSYTDTVAAGTYFYVVKADDAAGNVSAASNEVSVTVTSDTSPPSVSITAPAAGATVSATVSVTASASDNVGVAGVQFKLDGANLGAEDTSSPYSVSWDTTTASNGTHTLTAVARDAAGNTTTSAAVTVTVSNTAPTGLVAAYNFNAGSGTTLADRSGTGNNGTIANGTWSTSGHTGGALSFNGTSTLVTIPDSASLDLTNSLTLEAWVNPSALGTAWRCVLFKEQPNDMIYSLYANQNTTRPIGQVFTGGIEQNSTGSAALTLNAWAHLAVTYDGTALKLYVNGTLVHTTLVTGALPTSTGPLHMGGDSVWGEWFKGLIDDVRVYNVALTQAQIQTDMNTPVP